VNLKSLFLAFGFAAALSAQTAPASTTLALPVSVTDSQVVLASGTGVLPGMLLYFDRETMQIASVFGATVQVYRGIQNTNVLAHSAGVPAYFGTADQFFSSDPKGACSANAALTFVRPQTGDTFTCTANSWLKVGTSGGSVTAANVAAAIQTQSGCTTSGFVWIPVSNTCVAQSGSTPSGTPNKVVASDPTGAATNPAALRALVPLDIPALPYQAPIGFTPENIANKGAVSGYAPLDATSKVPAANIPILNQATTGNAATATQLAANGANCAAGNYPLGVDAFGAVEGCTPATGGGTVTATPGALIAGAVVVGNGGTDTKTPSVTTTLDASGNLSTPGAVTSGAGGTGSGIFAFPGGTQATSIALAPTNSSGYVGPSPAPTGKHFLANPATGAAANQFLLFGAEASSISLGLWTPYAQTISQIANNFLTGFNATTGVFTQGPAAVTGGVNAQTANYTLAASDSNKLVTMTGTSLTASLPATPPSATWSVAIQNLSPTTNLIVSRGTLLINGGAVSYTLLPYQLIPFYTDGTNYFARPTYQAGTNTTLTTGPAGIQINATGGGTTTQNWGIAQGAPTAQAAATTDWYSPLSNGFANVESNRSFVPGAGTLKNLTIKTNSAQSVGGNMVCNVRVNGVNATQSITIATSGAAGTFQDATNTTATLDMDTVSIGCLNNGTAGSAQISGIYIQHVH